MVTHVGFTILSLFISRSVFCFYLTLLTLVFHSCFFFKKKNSPKAKRTEINSN